MHHEGNSKNSLTKTNEKINPKKKNRKVLTSVEDKHGKVKHHLSKFYQYSIVHIAENRFPCFLNGIVMQAYIINIKTKDKK